MRICEERGEEGDTLVGQTGTAISRHEVVLKWLEVNNSQLVFEKLKNNSK
jgi:hypothetical protein